jgi:hypothetical protein
MTTRMKPCFNCMPKGVRGKASHVYDFVELTPDNFVWAWCCENCGHIKKPRTRTKRKDYDYVSQEALSDKDMNTENTLRFHAFNPNGLYAQVGELHKAISKWVDENPDRPNGVLLVHGSFNDFPRKTLFNQLAKKTRPSGLQVWSIKRTFERALEHGYAWLEENK